MIDTKLLRQKILDLAIRGKLVPQDPADEPASELLKKIKAEKEALVKAGKIKKDKHESHIFKGDDNRYYETIEGKTADITDEIPFDLPSGWAWCRLNGICQSIIDGDHQPPPQCPQGIPFLVISNISDGQLSFKQTRFVTEEYYNSLPEIRVPQYGDILLTVTGSYGIAVQIKENRKFCFQRHIALLKTILTNNKLLEQWLSSGFSKKQFDNSVTGTAQQTLGLNALRATLLPLPPLAEQQRIVEQIETLLGYVDIIDADAETLEKSITLAKQKILDLAIRGKLVPQYPADEPASELLKKIKAEKEALIKAGKIKKDKHESFIYKGDDNCYHENIDGKVTDITDEIPFDLPDGWEWSRLYSITSFLHRGKSPKYTDEKKYPMFAQKCNQKDGIHMEKALFCLPEQYEKFPSEYKLQNCDIVINSTGTGTLGRVGIFYKRFLNNYESTVPDSHVTLVRAFENYILGEYLYACFKSPSYQQMMLDNADGSTNQKELYTKVLELFFIPLPPLAEQKRIVSQVEKLFSVLETMQG